MLALVPCLDYEPLVRATGVHRLWVFGGLAEPLWRDDVSGVEAPNRLRFRRVVPNSRNDVGRHSGVFVRVAVSAEVNRVLYRFVSRILLLI